MTALAPSGSVGFVSSVFRLYRSGRPFVVARSPEAAAALDGLDVDGFEDPGDAKGWFAERHEPISSASVAQIIYTSGTTGASKGILLSHDNLADTVHRLVAAQGLDATVSEYVGVPPGYSFGLGRVRACAAVGGRIYLPPRGFDPVEIGRMLHDREINALSAVPTLLRLLLERPGLMGTAGRQMRWIEIGSQSMAREEKERLKAIFPEARIVQHYGLTEAARTTLLDVSAMEGEPLESVGRPTGDTQVALSPDGRIRIRGLHVAREWIGRDGIRPLVDADGWLTTNDAGRIDRDGFLFFLGRTDDLINFGGVKLVPDLIEASVRARLARPGRLAVARIPDHARGDGILLATDDAGLAPTELRAAALDAFADFGVAAGNGLEVAIVPTFPTTDTGKVRRRALADAFLVERDAENASRGRAAGDEASGGAVLDAFRAAFPRRRVTPGDSFNGLGGDSLAHVSILARLDDGASGLADGWEERTISDLQGVIRPDVPHRAGWLTLRPISPELFIRSIAVVMIVAHHAFLSDLGGGIEVLLLLVGVNLARFQTGRLASADRWTLLADLALRLVLPYYAVLLAFHSLHPRQIGISDYLLFSNFRGRFTIVAPYWFVQGYVQSILLLVLAVSVPAVRRTMSDRPATFGVALLGAAVLVKVAAMAVFHHAAMLGRTPDQFFYIVALGWCTQSLRGRVARMVLAGSTLGIAVLATTDVWSLWSGFDGRWHGLALLGAVLLLLYPPTVRVPNLVRALVTEIALASLVIYLTHPLILDQLREVVPPALQMMIALPFGVAFARLLQVASRYLPRAWGLPRAEVSTFGRSR